MYSTPTQFFQVPILIEIVGRTYGDPPQNQAGGGRGRGRCSGRGQRGGVR